MDTQLVVLGGGPGGYSAAFRAADLGLAVTLVERWPVLGGVCLNVGCIPSKALLHAARVIAETKEMAEHGLSFGEPTIDLDSLKLVCREKSDRSRFWRPERCLRTVCSWQDSRRGLVETGASVNSVPVGILQDNRVGRLVGDG